MLTFIEFLEENHNEFFNENKKKGLFGRVLHVAKNMPMTVAALGLSAAGLAGVDSYERFVGDGIHSEIEKPPEKLKPGLPPLKKSKNKVVGKIEDAGMA